MVLYDIFGSPVSIMPVCGSGLSYQSQCFLASQQMHEQQMQEIEDTMAADAQRLSDNLEFENQIKTTPLMPDGAWYPGKNFDDFDDGRNVF